MLNINNNLVDISKIGRFLFFHVNHIPQAIPSELICFHMPMIRTKNLITVEGQVNKTLVNKRLVCMIGSSSANSIFVSAQIKLNK